MWRSGQQCTAPMTHVPGDVLTEHEAGSRCDALLMIAGRVEPVHHVLPPQQELLGLNPG
jgi:hypothetical protein